MKWYEVSQKKNSGLQMDIKPTTFRTLVGCSNQWDTENSWMNRSIVSWHNLRIAQSSEFQMGIEPTTIYGQYMGFFARHLIVPQCISQPPYNKRRYDLDQKLGRSNLISPKIRNCYDLITQTNGINSLFWAIDRRF